MIGMAVITQVANSVLRTGILGMGLPGDGYGYEGRIQAYIPHIDPPISREFREGPQSALR